MKTMQVLAALLSALCLCHLAAAGGSGATESIVTAVSGVCVDSNAPSACVLVDLLSSCQFDAADSDELTIFLPRDTSFSDEELRYLQNDKKVACEIMKYHVVEGAHADVKGTEQRLFSLLHGFPVELTTFQSSVYLNAKSIVSGSKLAPPRVVYTSSRTDNVVVHVIDSVATPFINKAVYTQIFDEKVQLKTETGRSFFPYVTGAQGLAIGGTNFYTRNAFGQVYNPFTGIWLNIFQGYSNDPGLYCQSVRCGAAVNSDLDISSGARVGGDDLDAFPDIPESVVAAAVATPDLSILVDAVVAAGLDGALGNPDAVLTVLAPTNDAFVALLDALGLSGLEDIPVEVLTQVLLYHVIPDAAIDSATLLELLPTTVDTLETSSLSATLVDDSIVFEGFASSATVIQADVFAGNAVIHVIDAVLLPEIAGVTSAAAPEMEPEPETDMMGSSDLSVAELALGEPDLSILVEAVVAADFLTPLSVPEAVLTVFAPINSAFEELLAELGADSLEDIPVELLQDVLAYHVVADEALDKDDLLALAEAGEEVETVLGSPLSFSEGPDGGVIVNAVGSDANVIVHAIMASGSLVNIIDSVLLPVDLGGDR